MGFEKGRLEVLFEGGGKREGREIEGGMGVWGPAVLEEERNGEETEG